MLKRKRGNGESSDLDRNSETYDKPSKDVLDSDEWFGITDDAALGVGTNESTHSRPLTAGDLSSITDATELFLSASFKLQIDALLPNVRPFERSTTGLDSFLFSLHAFLIALPSADPIHPLDAERRLKGIAVPYVLPLPSWETKWKVGFVPPEKGNIFLAGSWANHVAVKRKDSEMGIPPFVVDLAVEMDNSLFQEKDYLDARVFQKRAFYLATMAAAIKDAIDVDVEYESANGDPRLTVLVLTPRKDSSLKDLTKLGVSIRIIPVLSMLSPIPLQRLSPRHSNIRVSSNYSSDQTWSTPLYNSALLLSFTPKSHILFIRSLLDSTPAFKDALTLLRVWANQRGYAEGERPCVRGFEGKGTWWACLLGTLIEGADSHDRKGGRKPLGKGLSCYQLFRAVLDFLAKHDWEKEMVFMKTMKGHTFHPDEYKAHHEAVFLDSTSLINLLTSVPLGSLEMLRHDARQTLEMLDGHFTGDLFKVIFLDEQRNLATRFDAVIRVDLSGAKLPSPSVHASLDHGSIANTLVSSLASLLRRGLGNRTKAIAILHRTNERRPLSQGHPVGPAVVHVGLIYDPQHAFRIVDHGPSAGDPDSSIVKEFREFWGEKAELRRFKNGKITESVVWDVHTPDDRHQVPAMVVQHVLKTHMGLGSNALQVVQGSFNHVLCLPEPITKIYQSCGITGGFKAALVAFDDLVKNIRASDSELPLSLMNVSPTSEYLRYTSVLNPVPFPASMTSSLPLGAQYRHPIEIILQFEKSTRWPDDLRAIQKIKLAMFERIADGLMKLNSGTQAAVVLDAVSAPEIQDRHHLEIVTPSGWAFFARIYHDRELTLLDRLIDNKPNHRIAKRSEDHEDRERKHVVQSRALFNKRFIHAPRHHRAVATLCHRFLAYSGTVRLVKRWLASHWLLRGHVSEEAVEIICASFFVRNGQQLENSACIPRSMERGFSLVVQYLKDWNWEKPLFIPLYGHDSELGSVSNWTTPSASTAVWRLQTEADNTGQMWTESGPDIMAANRVRTLAKATWDVLQGVEIGNFAVGSIFAHPHDDYDFTIQLDPEVLPRYAQNVNVNTNVLLRNTPTTGEIRLVQRTGLDPASMFFDDLQRIYADVAKFFYDPIGGDVFGAVWKPNVRDRRPFKILNGYSSFPIIQEKGKDKKGVVTLNETALLQEIERLGVGLIRSVNVKART